uniref:LAGLIDADG homing endonuclease n=1 Tax=Termitomyces sp. TaxID=1916073 RepID=A0A386TY99_9AGAR|nr:LAGLIDADG homing endonuclease [Termitomyces sp.]
MVTLFLSLGLYAGNLGYNFGPLSLALYKGKVKVIKKNILALFGKIQNFYYKIYFARACQRTQGLPLGLLRNKSHSFSLSLKPLPLLLRGFLWLWGQRQGAAYAPPLPPPLPLPNKPPQKAGQREGAGEGGPEACVTKGPFAPILGAGEMDKLRSQKAVLHSLVLSVFNHIITNLNFKNEQSAGNSLLLSRTQLKSNFISPWPPKGALAEKYHISDHLIKHKKPSCPKGPKGPKGTKGPKVPNDGSNNVDFGYYLSGLIEGNGLFEDHKLEIKFQEKDISLAYYIKKEIGYGKVIKETNLKQPLPRHWPANAAPLPAVRMANKPKVACYAGKRGQEVKYVLTHYEGLKKVLNLLNGKLININTINQLLTHKYNTIFNIDILPPANFDITSNYWLTGFIDAKGNFGINTLENSDNFILEFYIKYPQTKDPKGENFFILNLIKKTFGAEGTKRGNIYLDGEKSPSAPSAEQTFVYKTSDVKSIKLIIDYLDKFQLNSYKHVKFFKWRKVYRIIQRKEHCLDKNIKKIKKIEKNLRD